MRIVVVGGGAAGMSTASRIKRIKPDFDVMVFESSNMVSHAPCGIPYFLEGLFNDESLFMHYTPDYFINVRGIKVRTNVSVVKVYDNFILTNTGERVEWDYLVLATGSIPRIPSAPISGDRVFTIHHPSRAMETRKLLESANTVGIVGSGYIGLEVAEAMRVKGKEVIMVSRSSYPLSRSLDGDMSMLIIDEMVRSGVKVKLNESLIEVSKQGGSQVIITDSGKYIVDAVVLATGVVPNVELANMLNLRIGETGAVWVNEHMITSNERIYAVGDVAETTSVVTGKPYWHPFGTTANKMGYIAGSNIAGLRLRFPGVAGTSMTRFMNLYAASTGLTEREAIRHGLKVTSVIIKAETRARYYPGHGELTVKLIAEKGSGRIIGGQFIGNDGGQVLGRVNTLASLILKRATVEDLFLSDLAYLPPVTQVWDPLIIAARQLFNKL
ncbi:MAG: FAD-dependent oxidoreductase [Caldivirga sp.]|uniref:FAD-dependent oxidoreductase n=1 Tax=Caldivirga sp. TaxID=2080243 RepID=UPI003D0F20BC